MAQTMATEGWLVSRNDDDGSVKHLGFFESRKVAEKQLPYLRGEWFVVGPVPLLGWGFIKQTGRLLTAPPLSCPSEHVH